MCEKRSACSSQVAHIWSHIPCSDFIAIVYFFTASLYLSYFKQISCQKLYCTVYCMYSVRTVYITEECFEERKKLQYSYHVCAKLFKDPNSKISHFMFLWSQGLRKCWRYTLHKISKKIFCKNTFLSLQQGGAFKKKKMKRNSICPFVYCR